MTGRYDFAIFGASPLAALLAGLLAHDCGKRVIRVAEARSAQRLPRTLDLALPFATRPQTWRLLRASSRETLALLHALEAADAIAPTDAELVADLPDSAAALAHMSHVAAGYGQSARAGVFRRVPQLIREIALEDSKVRSVETAEIAGDDVIIAGEPVAVGKIVLADDAAILARLPEGQRPARLVSQPMTVTLTAPTRRLAAPIMRFLDRGVTLAQRPDLAVLAFVAGERDVEIRLASCLPGPFPLQRRASSHFRRLMTADGAPLLGPLAAPRPFIIAGLGDAAAFLAPPIARLLAGKPTDDERDWFAAHDAAVARRDAVADFAEVLP